jgi:hypothetical protein
VTPPRPEALRLLKRAPRARTPKPPLGIAAWNPTADAVAVLLDAGGDADPRTVAGVVAQLPAPSDLPPGTPVLVLGRATTSRAFWRWITGDVAVPRVARCTALLARGYVDIGASDDLVWGYAPGPSAPESSSA